MAPWSSEPRIAEEWRQERRNSVTPQPLSLELDCGTKSGPISRSKTHSTIASGGLLGHVYDNKRSTTRTSWDMGLGAN